MLLQVLLVLPLPPLLVLLPLPPLLVLLPLPLLSGALQY